MKNVCSGIAILVLLSAVEILHGSLVTSSAVLYSGLLANYGYNVIDAPFTSSPIVITGRSYSLKNVYTLITIPGITLPVGASITGAGISFYIESLQEQVGLNAHLASPTGFNLNGPTIFSAATANLGAEYSTAYGLITWDPAVDSFRQGDQGFFPQPYNSGGTFQLHPSSFSYIASGNSIDLVLFDKIQPTPNLTSYGLNANTEFGYHAILPLNMKAQLCVDYSVASGPQPAIGFCSAQALLSPQNPYANGDPTGGFQGFKPNSGSTFTTGDDLPGPQIPTPILGDRIAPLVETPEPTSAAQLFVGLAALIAIAAFKLSGVDAGDAGAFRLRFL